MNEYPKRIWIDNTILDEFDMERCPESDIPYIRADIVDELVEALKGTVRYAGSSGDDYLADKARAALAKLEESHD